MCLMVLRLVAHSTTSIVSDGRFVDLMHAHLEQRLHGGLVCDVADAGADKGRLGNEVHGHDAAASSGFHQMAAVGDARVE